MGLARLDKLIIACAEYNTSRLHPARYEGALRGENMNIIHDLAVLPKSRFVSNSSPFYKYCKGSEVLCNSYKDVVNAGIWAYQLLVYLEAVGEKFGRDVRDRVREKQLSIFNPEFTHAGDSRQVESPLTSLAMTMDLIEEEVRCHMLGLNESKPAKNAPVEMNIARTLLEYDFVTPYFTRGEDGSDEDLLDYRQRIEEVFSRCLLRCSEEIKFEYDLIIKNMEWSEVSCAS